MADVTLGSFSRMMRDHYPLPGTRIKQYVVDARRNSAWERETCPAFIVELHDDNTGLTCRESGRTPWFHLEGHDCCLVCNERADELRSDPSVVAWLAERAARPALCADLDQLSDEVEPTWPHRRRFR